MTDSLAGVILTGGRSRRMGTDKASLLVGGRPLITWVADALAEAVHEVWCIGGDPSLAQSIGARFAPDALDDGGPLGGLYSALLAAKSDVILVGCDMPLLQPRFLRGLASMASLGDALVPLNRGLYEPLLALYRATCLNAVERSLTAGGRRISAIYGEVNTRLVTEPEWRVWDPDGLSFANVNTPDELKAVRARLEATRDWAQEPAT